jgi:hypothetical protein
MTLPGFGAEAAIYRCARSYATLSRASWGASETAAQSLIGREPGRKISIPVPPSSCQTFPEVCTTVCDTPSGVTFLSCPRPWPICCPSLDGTTFACCAELCEDCVQGRCQSKCEEGLTCCNGACVECPVGGVCSGTACVCPAGQTNCNGTCVACPGGGVCSGTACVCPEGQVDCRGTCGPECPNGMCCQGTQTCCDTVIGWKCCDWGCKSGWAGNYCGSPPIHFPKL